MRASMAATGAVLFGSILVGAFTGCTSGDNDRSAPSRETQQSAALSDGYVIPEVPGATWPMVHFEGHVTCAELGLGNASATLDLDSHGFGPFFEAGEFACALDGGGRFPLSLGDAGTFMTAFGQCSTFRWSSTYPVDAVILRATDWGAFVSGSADTDEEATPRAVVALHSPSATSGFLTAPPRPLEGVTLDDYYRNYNGEGWRHVPETPREIEVCFTVLPGDGGVVTPDGGGGTSSSSGGSSGNDDGGASSSGGGSSGSGGTSSGGSSGKTW